LVPLGEPGSPDAPFDRQEGLQSAPCALPWLRLYQQWSCGVRSRPSAFLPCAIVYSVYVGLLSMPNRNSRVDDPALTRISLRKATTFANSPPAVTLKKKSGKTDQTTDEWRRPLPARIQKRTSQNRIVGSFST